MIDKKYETIEINLSDFSREVLEYLIEYSMSFNITVEQTINRFMTIICIINDPTFKPVKVPCECCGTMFYGDVASKCMKCDNPNDDFLSEDIIEELNNCRPLWMIVDDKTSEYLR